MWGTSQGDVYAVGAGGTVIHFDGSNWSVMTTETSQVLSAVGGVAGRYVFAGGETGTILRYAPQ